MKIILRLLPVLTLLLAACSTPIDIQPPAPAPTDAPPPPDSSGFEEQQTRPRTPFVCPQVPGEALQPGGDASAPSIARGINFHQFQNLRFETLSLVRKGMLSNYAEHNMTSTELDKVFYRISNVIGDEWRQRLAWVTPPGRGGRTISADLWLEDYVAGSASGTTRLGISLRDHGNGNLLLSQCHVPISTDDNMAGEIRSWASALASHMQAAGN